MLIFLLLGSALLAIFHKPLISAFIQWQLRSFVSRMAGGELYFEEIYIDDSHITLSHPYIIANGQTLATSEKVIIEYSIHLFSREIDADISLVGTQLFINPSALPPDDYSLSKLPHSTFYHWNISLIAPDGKLCLAHQQIPIAIDHHNNQTRIDLLFANTLCTNFSPLVHYLPSFIVDRNIVSGEIEGDLHMVFSKGALLDILGDLTVRDLLIVASNGSSALGNLKGGIHFFSQKMMHFDLICNPQEEGKNIPCRILGEWCVDGWKASFAPNDSDFIRESSICFASQKGLFSFALHHHQSHPHISPLLKSVFQLCGIKLKENIFSAYDLEPTEVTATFKHDNEKFFVDGEAIFKENSCSFSVQIPQSKDAFEGTFCATHLPIKRYIQSKNNIIDGFADVQGEFNQRQACLQYRIYDFNLDNEEISIECNKSLLQGSHTIDFLHGTHSGSLSISEAQCLDKKRQLLFTNVHAQLNITENGYCYGSVTEGSLAFPSLSAVMYGICLDFDYRGNSLNMTDVQALLLIGNSLAASEEYIFVSDYIKIDDISQNKISFDLWVGDKTRDIIRFVGHTHPHPNLKFFDVVFDKQLTHFVDMHPNIFLLTIADWKEVQELQISGLLHLDAFWHDLQRITKTVGHTASHNMFSYLQEIDHVSGLVTLDLEYKHEEPKEVLNFHIQGEKLHVNDLKFNKLLLTGKKTDNIWTLEHLQLDDILLSADIIYKDEALSIPFMGLRLGDLALIGMQGTFFTKQRRLQASLNLCEIHLDSLLELGSPNAQKIFAYLVPQGTLKATGTIVASFPQNFHKWNAEAKLYASTQGLSYQELAFPNSDHFFIQIAKDCFSTRILFPEVTCLLEQQSYALRHCALIYHPTGLTFSGECLLQQQWLSFNAIIPAMKTGMHTLHISNPNEEGWTAEWMHSTDGITFRHVSGQLLGCHFALHGEENDQKIDPCLRGEISGDLIKFLRLIFPQIIPDSSACYGNYKMQGTWIFDSQQLTSYQFAGKISGSNCYLYGYQLDQLTAQMHGSKQTVSFNDISLTHHASEIVSEKMTIFKNQQGETCFFIPRLHMTHLVIGKESFTNNAFIIKEGEIIDCKGKLAAPKSFSAKGKMRFNHPIPFPMAKMNNLDIHADFLTPTSGTIHFDIRDEKIFITHLEHVHSENKLSKFSLSKTLSPSYIDFNGDLHLQLQVKPYQMISKLADLFTLSIDGSIAHPICKFRRHNK